MKTKSYGFTIVELLVVIVVIGILAAITIVSYTGISHKAKISSLQSDLSNSSKQLNLFQVEKSTYPTTISTNCSTNPTDATNLCIKTNSTNTYGYRYYSPNGYMLVSMNGNTCYSITNNSAPVENCVTIGTQTWMKYNLDVGTIKNYSIDMANDSIVEKWCYDNDPVNCTISGGLYQWNEMMEYSTTPGTQGIAPTGFHIPTDAEYTTLITYLGGEAVAADKMKKVGHCQGRTPCGTSGWDGLLGGYNYGSSWFYLGSATDFWSSSQSSVSNAWNRLLYDTDDASYRYDDDKTFGFSVRAIKD